MNDTVIFIGALLLGTFLSSVSQVMLKKATLREYSVRWREYINPLVITAYAIFFVATLLSVFAYRRLPLSMGAVMETTGYLYVTLFGVIIFKEKMTLKKSIALLLIVAGILIYSVFG